MIFYQPKTKFGSVEKSVVHGFLKLNAVWPLKVGVSQITLALYRITALLWLMCYALDIYGQIQFIALNLTNIRVVTECMCTALIGTQNFWRTLYNVLRADTMRRFIEMFYMHIYISK